MPKNATTLDPWVRHCIVVKREQWEKAKAVAGPRGFAQFIREAIDAKLAKEKA
jgi:hypothetical protein